MLVQLVELATTLLEWVSEDGEFITEKHMYVVLLYMTMTREQEQLMLEDPNQFISDEDNEFTTKDLKSWCSDFMFEVIDQHAKVQYVLNAVEKLLVSNEDDSHLTSNTEEFQLKKKEAGLY